MIVKVQKPLAWPAEIEPMVLIYNQHRTVELQAPYDERWQAMFALMEPLQKLFFKATLIEDNKLNITGQPINYDPGW